MRSELWKRLYPLIAVVLVITASMKLIGVVVDPYQGELSPWLSIIIAIGELLFSGYMFLFGHLARARYYCMLLFVAFMAYLLALDIAGIGDCGCLGAVKSSPMHMILLDMAIVAVALVGKPSSSVRVPELLYTFQMTMLSVGFLLLFIVVFFSNPATIFGKIFNKGIVVEPAMLDVGAGVAGTNTEKMVDLVNLTDQEITVTGAHSSCSCFAASALPVKVPPRGRVSIPVTVKFKGNKVFTQYQILTNYKASPVFTARVSGKVLDAHSQ